MVKDKKASSENYVYQAPALFVGIFYLLLTAWVLFCFLFFESTFSRLGFSLPYGLIMIAFIVFMTCYFSLGISYKIEVGNDGQIRLTSYRRIIDTNAEDIQMIEGPHLPLGFIKFRLERENPDSRHYRDTQPHVRRCNPVSGAVRFQVSTGERSFRLHGSGH